MKLWYLKVSKSYIYIFRNIFVFYHYNLTIRSSLAPHQKLFFSQGSKGPHGQPKDLLAHRLKLFFSKGPKAKRTRPIGCFLLVLLQYVKVLICQYFNIPIFKLSYLVFWMLNYEEKIKYNKSQTYIWFHI